MTFYGKKSSMQTSTCLRFFLFLLLAQSVDAGNFPIPQTSFGSLRFEAEKTSDDSHGHVAAFVRNRYPDDRYWAEPEFPDGNRFATRGNDASHGTHRFEWTYVQAKEAASDQTLYDVRVRVKISDKGRYDLSFRLDGNTPLHVSADARNGDWQWVTLGSIELPAGEHRFALEIKTTKSAVRVDALELLPVADLFGILKLSPKPIFQNEAKTAFFIEADEVTLTLGTPSARPVKTTAFLQNDDQDGPVIQTWDSLPDSIAISGRGFHRLSILVPEAKGTIATNQYDFALLGPPLPAETLRRSIFGLWNVHGPIELLPAVGAHWNRRMVSLRNVTAAEADPTLPRPKQPYLETIPGVDSVGVFSFGLPAWTLGPKGEGMKAPSFMPATNWTCVANAAAAFVSLQAKSGRLLPRHLSLYNEPLAHWRGSHAELVDCFRAIRNGVHSVNPDFLIGGPGLYSVRIGDLESLASAGLLELLDFVDLHAYVGGTPPEAEFRENLIALRKWLEAKGYAHLPVFLTEFGWTRADGTWQPSVPPDDQASYVTRSLAIAWAEKIDGLVYFALQFKTDNRGEAGFSLLTQDGAPTPALTAFSAIAKFLAAAKPFGFFEIAPEAYAAIGTDQDNRLLLVCWNKCGTQSIQLPSPPLSVRNRDGAPLPVSKFLHISPSPILVTLPASANGPILAPLHSFTDVASLRSTRYNGSPLHLIALPDSVKAPKPGNYLALHSDASGNDCLIPVSFLQPLQILRVTPDWPSGSQTPRLRVLVKSNISEGETPAELAFGNRVVSFILPPNGLRSVAFPIRNAVPARRRQDTVSLRSKYGQIEETIDWTPVSALQLNERETSEAMRAPKAEFTDWLPLGTLENPTDAPVPTEIQTRATTDLRGFFAAFTTPEALILSIDVLDEEHVQTALPKEPQRAWAGDSIQFAIDLDYGKAWEAGFAGDGASDSLGGHRVFEWTAAADGTHAAVFLHSSRTPGLPANSVRPDISCSFSRIDNRSSYTIKIPWKEVGLSTPPPSPVLGFSLLVNDIDPSRNVQRHGIRLFDGIATEKSPKKYGPLFIR